MKLKSSAIFWFLLFVCLAEIGARFASPYSDIIAEARPYLRNPLPYRGWPEYVSVTAGRYDLVLLGNSQAVGIEYPIADDIYSSQLATLLRGNNPEVVLHNWSVVGLRHHQLELLALKAVERRQKLLIFVVSLNNFGSVTERSIVKDPTDIPELLGDFSLFPDILRSQLAVSAKLDSAILSAIRRQSALARSRTRFFDFIAQRLPRRHQAMVFGHRRSTRAMTPISQRKEVAMAQQVTPMQVRMSKQRWINQLRTKQLIQARTLYRNVSRVLDESHSKMVWIWMPFALREDTRHILEAMQVVHQEFCQNLRADGVTCMDLSDGIAPEFFISPDLSSHLSKPGHKAMAALMEPIILDAIH